MDSPSPAELGAGPVHGVPFHLVPRRCGRAVYPEPNSIRVGQEAVPLDSVTLGTEQLDPAPHGRWHRWRSQLEDLVVAHDEVFRDYIAVREVEADAIVAIVINRVLHDPHAGGLVNVDSVVAVSLNEILLQNDTRRLGHVDTVPRRHGERDRRDYR